MYPIGSFDKGQGHQFNSMLGPNGLAFFQTLHILLPTTLILHKSHRHHCPSGHPIRPHPHRHIAPTMPINTCLPYLTTQQHSPFSWNSSSNVSLMNNVQEIQMFKFHHKCMILYWKLGLLPYLSWGIIVVIRMANRVTVLAAKIFTCFQQLEKQADILCVAAANHCMSIVKHVQSTHEAEMKANPNLDNKNLNNDNDSSNIQTMKPKL